VEDDATDFCERISLYPEIKRSGAWKVHAQKKGSTSFHLINPMPPHNLRAKFELL
jgi:hypothetical protein